MELMQREYRQGRLSDATGSDAAKVCLSNFTAGGCFLLSLFLLGWFLKSKIRVFYASM